MSTLLPDSYQPLMFCTHQHEPCAIRQTSSKVAPAQCRSEVCHHARAIIPILCRGQKVKSVLVAPNRCHLTLGIFCCRCHNCCKTWIQTLWGRCSLPLLGAKPAKNTFPRCTETNLFSRLTYLSPPSARVHGCRTSQSQGYSSAGLDFCTYILSRSSPQR